MAVTAWVIWNYVDFGVSVWSGRNVEKRPLVWWGSRERFGIARGLKGNGIRSEGKESGWLQSGNRSVYHRGSESADGRKSKSPEWRARIADSVRRYYAENPNAVETRRLLREKKLGDRNPMFGKTMSEELREKLSTANKGRSGRRGSKHSEESRKKISAALRKYHAGRREQEELVLLRREMKSPISQEALSVPLLIGDKAARSSFSERRLNQRSPYLELKRH